MKLNHEVAKENFDKLLDWLSHDRDEAGVRFEQIRDGLVRYFRLKGCHEPETLADESMNRVIRRIDTLDLTKNAKPSTIVYGFAANVFLEYYRSEKKRTLQLSDTFEVGSARCPIATTDTSVECLRQCLSNLDNIDVALIVEYYSQEKQSKTNVRRQLAMQNNITIGTLHTRIHRIKGILRPCVEECVNKERL